ncbi:MAG: NIPSNAP family protein [Betaproteobacteria bacterium]|nr:NIPSNAP family protein [Betaproteobacteria bacterium]
MIYEVRTYDLKPHSLPEVEKRFAEAYETRKKFSQLAAFWHTEIGPLNQIIHVWPYKDLEERGRIRDTAVKEGAGKWPPKTAEFLARQRSEIFMQFSFSPEIKPGKQGPFFEMRVYTYAAGQLGNLTKAWEAAIPNRLKHGPATAIWYSELGGLNQFVHIWPYKSLDERWAMRNKLRETGEWPPSVVAKKLGLPDYHLVQQENKIVMPSAFSPLQ